ncbi:hypothetical protein ACTNES_15190 [Blautia sp. HCP3S3_D9]|uniref:hypothetical protein n=1 Tax=Blautia sp. HCP3S3_D9 TaxID=3438912 RepID=UPI003F88C53E
MAESKVIPKKRKGRKKKVIAVSLVGVLAAGGIGGALYYKQNSVVKMPEDTKQAQSATAELGSISNTIVGTGNLALADAQSQTIPSGIEIEEVTVESGDQVTKGDTIATVSKASVLKAVEETQEEIQELDEQISDCQDDDDTDTIDASVDGRVKLIYAETVSGSTCTVTVTDNGTTYDDEVIVTDSDGKELGTGNLYIHEPLEITGTTGTVSAVNVSENESVTSGTELLTLENSASDAHYEQLLAQREAYSATLKKLLQLSKNQKITADISGTIQSVNVSASSSDSSSSTSSGSAGSSGSVNVSKMSYAASTGKNTDSGKSKNSSVNNNISASENRKTKVPAVSFTVNCDNRTAAKTISNSQAGIIGLSSTMQMPAGTSYKIITLSSENTDENETVENIEKITDQEEQTQAEAAASECSNEEDVDAFAADAEENAESSADMVSAGFK